MSYFFSDLFRTQLATNQTILDGQKLKLVLFRYAPTMGSANPAWTAARTVAELVAQTGWVEVANIPGYPLTTQIDVSTRSLGTIRTVTDGVTTSGSPNVTSATANFTPSDVGLMISGNGIPVNTKIITRTSATAAVMSANATASATGVTFSIGSGSRYLMYSQYPFTELSTLTEVRAIGVVFVGTLGGQTNPLLMVTNTPIGGVSNLAPTDALTSSPDATFPDNTNRWLMGWSRTTPDPTEGPLVISRGSPSFEVSGSQHCWLYPQRANMVANPSFEAPGTAFWSGNSALTRISGGAPGAGAWAGSCAGTGGYAIMESNLFPTQMGDTDSEQWTVQLMAKGTGKLKVGFVFWDADYRVTACDWGTTDDSDESWVLSPTAWTHVATHRHAPEGHIAMVRLELQGAGPLIIDKVLAERGYLKDWLYFDGDEHYGARDDFSWYGGTNRQGASYSLWYNHRKAVTGRLFARTVDPNDPSANVTDEDMEEQGLVYRWVPAGITVVPHLDVFYPFDVQNPLPAKSAGVLARYSTGTPDGVSNPW